MLDAVRWQIPVPIRRLVNSRANPVGLTHDGEDLIKAKCPPNYRSMAEAVNTVVAAKFGPGGVYQDQATFDRVYKDDFGSRYLKEASAYGDDVINCVRDVCTFIHDTHGRFPAHCDAIHVPGIWLQVRDPEIKYHDTYFRDGPTGTHRQHGALWHSR